MCERTYICISIYTHTYTHIYSTPNDPAPPHKILENAVFLSVAPAFVYLLERGQHEHS